MCIRDRIGTIPRLAAVKLLVEGKEWSYVGYNGQYGYVMTRYLTTTQPTGDDGSGSSSSGSCLLYTSCRASATRN